MGEDLEKLKQRLSLLDYLRQQNWVFRPAGHGPEFVGLCPLHPETRPSFSKRFVESPAYVPSILRLGEPASNADVGLDAAAKKLTVAEKKSGRWPAFSYFRAAEQL